MKPNKTKNYAMDTPPLARGPGGAAIVLEYPDQPNRYIYKDGTIDRKSTVDTRNPILLIGGIITGESVTVIESAPVFEAQI